MRALLLAPALLLAACGSGEGGDNAADAAPGNDAGPPVASPTGPPPKTPVLDVPGAPGNEAAWIGAQPAPGDPTSAPYGNLLDQPLVNREGR